MLIGQQLGPFLIEKELGAGAMGAVYRGKYVEEGPLNGQLVAVKIMAPGLGTSSNSATKRFDREATILKQLRHPNIVRLFGTGKYRGTAYYAMEYVQGESLDRVMARRDRMTWEEVVTLGQQLCDALQHAHEKGIIHRDLKPSNLMILSDGTLKLTDFGIAKDLDVTQLTGANNTIGTAAYMSPEQCRGDPDITYKSDLYSLGIVFYELITGRKPFIAENVMELFMMHVKGSFERPSRIVLDLPVWLDTLICQLMEKKPEQRPLDAAMVSKVLGSIADKVAAQQSAGVDVAKARLMDLPRGKRNPDETDRDAARTLLGGKRGKRKKKKQLHQMVWVQAGGLVLLLAGVILALVIALQPPSADQLYKRAEKLMASNDQAKMERAREGPIKEYLQRYGHLATAQTDQVLKWADDFDVARYEKLVERHVQHNRTKRGLDVQAQNEAEGLAFKAGVAEDEGDGELAKELWQKVIKEDPVRVAPLAKRRLQRLNAIANQEKEWEKLRDEMKLSRTEPKLDDFPRQAFLAWRQEKLGDRFGAKGRYEQLKEKASKEEGSPYWTLLAAIKCKQLRDGLTTRPQDREGSKKVIDKVLANAGKAVKAGSQLLNQRLLVSDIVALYEKDDDMTESVAEAKQLIKTIDTKAPPRSSS